MVWGISGRSLGNACCCGYKYLTPEPETNIKCTEEKLPTFKPYLNLLTQKACCLAMKHAGLVATNNIIKIPIMVMAKHLREAPDQFLLKAG